MSKESIKVHNLAIQSAISEYLNVWLMADHVPKESVKKIVDTAIDGMKRLQLSAAEDTEEA